MRRSLELLKHVEEVGYVKFNRVMLLLDEWAVILLLFILAIYDFHWVWIVVVAVIRVGFLVKNWQFHRRLMAGLGFPTFFGVY